MLQRKPLVKWTSRDLEKWRERLSKLLVLVGQAGDTREAWQVFYAYRDGKITYKEAEKKLKELIAKAKR